MREEGALVEQRSSIAAPFIFFIVLTFHLVSKFLDQSKRVHKGSASDREMQLRGEIKQLLKDASTMSQPSTFAQAAKLRRLAAAKEKELATYQESHNKEMKLSYDTSLKFLLLAKVFIYFLLIIWFWRAPVATISQQLVQPFGKFLSWSARSPLNNNVMVNMIGYVYRLPFIFIYNTSVSFYEGVGIIPWLILSTRVSRFVSRLFKWRI
ncbi:hypothetical protein Dsin_016878 [Dipteronia sinensis]|uniref:Uncharacterized protein n=1 Tax=Dipteronia sinensis TaxID=43782 RepID=A0AAE0AF53_9ROSI|nr:hypothetical protein Dsin_016878 [Dipteronia sinensis]